MRNFPTRFLIASSLIVILVGFVYGSIFAGIPYPDPTPEMSARYAFHSSISNTILVIGLGALLIGIVGGIAKFTLKNLSKTQEVT